MNNWYIVEFDETEYWQQFFLDKYGIEKVMTQYVFDAGWQVHCCEITPSYELWFVQHAPVFRDGMSDLEIEEAEDEMRRNNNQEQVEYRHCRGLDRMIAESSRHIVRLGEFESDEGGEQDAHNEQAEDAVEYCQGNWQF
jgi:hypothetical protein